MSTINDGGQLTKTVETRGMWKLHATGMTLRQYYAGQALAGLPVPHYGDDYILKGARSCWAWADALLATENEQRAASEGGGE